MELEKIYELIEQQQFDKKYNIDLFLDKNEHQIQFLSKDELLLLWIKIDDEDNNLLRVYSDYLYSIVKIDNIIKYLIYYFAITFDDWTI